MLSLKFLDIPDNLEICSQSFEMKTKKTRKSCYDAKWANLIKEKPKS